MKRLLFLAAVIVLFAGTQEASAQARKIVLFEHFTNASCAPCASQNPIFEENIMDKNKGNYIHIAYHTVWPGRDPMNAYNKEEVDTRVKFYGVSAVPTIVMEGNRYSGAPSGVTQDLLDRTSVESSPLRIRVTESSDGTHRTVQATFTSLGPVPTAGIRMRAAVVESEVNYASAPGTNGEKDFSNVFRRFLTTAAGEEFTPAAIGESVTQSWEYEYDLAEWDTTRIFTVVWVQLDGTHDVINASKSSIPAIELVTDDSQFKKSSAGQPSSFSARVENLGEEEANVRLSLSAVTPDDWSADYEVGGSATSGETDIAVPAQSTAEITVSVPVGSDPGIADLMLRMASLDDTELNPQHLSFGVISGVSDILVNNDNNWGSGGDTKAADFQDSYLTGIETTGSGTHAATSLSTFLRAHDAGVLDDVGHVYYNAGWAFPGLPDAFARAMMGFLSDGGNLFVAGQDVGWDTFDPDGRGTSATRAFYRSYLFANYTNDGSSDNAQLSFMSDDPLFGDMSPAVIENAYGSNSQGQPYMYPEVLRPTPEGVALAYYNNDESNVAAIYGEKNDFKSVYFGFGMEMLKDAAVRSEIMKRTWQWFHGVITSAEYEAAVQSLALEQNYPNPVSTTTVVPLDAAPRERQLRVYDINGRLVESRPVAPGAAQLRIQTDGYRPGVYYYQLVDRGVLVGTRMMQVVR